MRQRKQLAPSCVVLRSCRPGALSFYRTLTGRAPAGSRIVNEDARRFFRVNGEPVRKLKSEAAPVRRLAYPTFAVLPRTKLSSTNLLERLNER